jgi:ABC-type amino acid transport substrate-binding protein
MFGVGQTASRAERVDFSTPYLSSGMYGLTTATHPLLADWQDMDQTGIVICVQEGTYMEGFMRQYLQQAELLVVSNPQQREVEVRSGRADIFITDFPYGRKMLTTYDWARLLAPPPDLPRFNYAYAVAKGQPEWLARVNRFVSDIKQDGRLLRFAENNKLTEIALTK